MFTLKMHTQTHKDAHLVGSHVEDCAHAVLGVNSVRHARRQALGAEVEAGLQLNVVLDVPPANDGVAVVQTAAKGGSGEQRG
jgi:hypothetical protein